MADFIIDYGTKNSSFIKMYKVLKDMGIKNNKFFLKLYDPTLRGVDPYSPKLTVEQQARIYTEIEKNKWYYLREVVRVPVPGGWVPYELNRGNLALSWCKSMNLNLFLLMPRQNGKTIGAICDDTWVYNFGTTNTNMLYGNKELNDSKLNLKRFKDITDALPVWLKAIIIDERRDTNNETEIRSNRNNNTIKAMSSAKDPVAADKLGRGSTTPLLYWDEFAFLRFNKIIYESASPAQSKAQEMAYKMGRPFGKTITTTPNNLDKEEGAYCHQMISDSCPFDEEMYDWDRDRCIKYIDANSTNDFVHIQFSYKELGHSEDWFRKQCRALNNDLMAVKREILLEWTLANDTSPFTEEQLEAIGAHVKDPQGKLFLQEVYKIDFFYNIDRTRNWLIGVDVSGGLSKDSSAIVVSDPDTLQVVGEFRNNTIDTVDLARILIELVALYMPNAVVAIERNSYGKGVIDNLLRTPIANNLYWEMREVQAEKKVAGGRVIKQKTKTKVYGINTDVSSRDKMINEILKRVVNDEPECIVSKGIYEDIRNLQYKKSGKIEHREGAHDDGLFAYLVSRYMIGYGTNLARFMVGNNKSLNGKTVQQTREDIVRNMNYISMHNRPDYMSNNSFADQFIAEQQQKQINESLKSGSENNAFMRILQMNNDNW
jgi:hypothetical protein